MRCRHRRGRRSRRRIHGSVMVRIHGLRCEVSSAGVVREAGKLEQGVKGAHMLVPHCTQEHPARSLTTLTCPTEYNRTIVNTVIARRSEKLCDRSQKIHFSLTASSSIRIELIQMNAVRNRSSSIKVRGNAEICNGRSRQPGSLRGDHPGHLTCNPALRINNSKLQPMAVVKPRSKSW